MAVVCLGRVLVDALGVSVGRWVVGQARCGGERKIKSGPCVHAGDRSSVALPLTRRSSWS